MVDVLNTFLPPEVREFIEYKEWSIKTREGVDVFVARGGRVIPTLCVNGRKRFESVIPTLDELYAALMEEATAPQRETLGQALEAARIDYE